MNSARLKLVSILCSLAVAVPPTLAEPPGELDADQTRIGVGGTRPARLDTLPSETGPVRRGTTNAETPPTAAQVNLVVGNGSTGVFASVTRTSDSSIRYWGRSDALSAPALQALSRAEIRDGVTIAQAATADRAAGRTTMATRLMDVVEGRATASNITFNADTSGGVLRVTSVSNVELRSGPAGGAPVAPAGGSSPVATYVDGRLAAATTQIGQAEGAGNIGDHMTHMANARMALTGAYYRMRDNLAQLPAGDIRASAQTHLTAANDILANVVNASPAQLRAVAASLTQASAIFSANPPAGDQAAFATRGGGNAPTGTPVTSLAAQTNLLIGNGSTGVFNDVSRGATNTQVRYWGRSDALTPQARTALASAEIRTGVTVAQAATADRAAGRTTLATRVMDVVEGRATASNITFHVDTSQGNLQVTRIDNCELRTTPGATTPPAATAAATGGTNPDSNRPTGTRVTSLVAQTNMILGNGSTGIFNSVERGAGETQVRYWGRSDGLTTQARTALASAEIRPGVTIAQAATADRAAGRTTLATRVMDVVEGRATASNITFHADTSLGNLVVTRIDNCELRSTPGAAPVAPVAAAPTSPIATHVDGRVAAATDLIGRAEVAPNLGDHMTHMANARMALTGAYYRMRDNINQLPAGEVRQQAQTHLTAANQILANVVNASPAQLRAVAASLTQASAVFAAHPPAGDAAAFAGGGSNRPTGTPITSLATQTNLIIGNGSVGIFNNVSRGASPTEVRYYGRSDALTPQARTALASAEIRTGVTVAQAATADRAAGRTTLATRVMDVVEGRASASNITFHADTSQGNLHVTSIDNIELMRRRT